MGEGNQHPCARLERLVGIDFNPALAAVCQIEFMASAISGFLAIKYLLLFLGRQKVTVFVYYRILLGVFILGVQCHEFYPGGINSTTP